MQDILPLKKALQEAEANYKAKQGKADSLDKSAAEAMKNAKTPEDKTAAKAIQDEATAAQGDANVAQKAFDDAKTAFENAVKANEQEKSLNDAKDAATKTVTDAKTAQLKHIQEVFAKNPKVTQVYATKDFKNVFIDKQYADLHKRQMKKDYTVITRAEAAATAKS